jgi:hypothetical protein
VNHLVPCPSCARHVRQSEASCPFCSAELSLGHLPAPALPRTRLGRAATFAFGAGVVAATSLVGCGGDTDEGKKEGGGGGGTVTPVYGAPAAGMAGDGSSGGTANNGGSPSMAGGAGVPLYGGAPAMGGSAPIYGGAPPMGGAGLIYGAPPAGMDAGGNAGSGGNDANAGTGGLNVGPVYGTPPTPDQ